MNILHVYKTYYPDSVGGVEQVIKQITRATTPLGCTNRFFCLSPAPNPSILMTEDSEIFRFPLTFEIAATGFSFSGIAGFRKLAAWADVIHYHFPWPFADLLHFLTRVKKPAIVTYHSDIVRQKKLLKLYSPLQNIFLKAAAKIIATSPNYVATSVILKNFREKTTVIPIGLDKSSYPIPSENLKNQWRNKFPDGFFLFIGVMRYYKGLHILMEACKHTDYPVVIVGAGPIEKELKEKARNLNLSNIHFLYDFSFLLSKI